MSIAFRNRREAGRLLGEQLTEFADQLDVIVLALPRGGVPVAYEVAKALRAELDVFTVRKLGVPGHEELALGAIASGGLCVLDDDVVDAAAVSRETIDAIITRERRELQCRELEYRGEKSAANVRGRIVILVDDRMATGSTLRAAVVAIRRLSPHQIIVAVPISAPSTREWFAHEADDWVCARTPSPFYAVGLWYEDFSTTTDEEVREFLEKASSLTEPVTTHR